MQASHALRAGTAGAAHKRRVSTSSRSTHTAPSICAAHRVGPPKSILRLLRSVRPDARSATSEKSAARTRGYGEPVSWAGVDVLVAGGGPAGLAVARGCLQIGLSVAVAEATQQDSRVGTGLTLWPNAMTALRMLGAESIVTRCSREMPGMTVRTPWGRHLQRVDAAAMQHSCGGVGRALLRADLIAALSHGLPDGTVRWGTRVTGFVRDQRSCTLLTSRGPMAGTILVGADGGRSLIRAGLSLASPERRLGMRVVRGVSSIMLNDQPAELTLGRGLQFGVFAMRAGTYWFAAGPRRQFEPLRAPLVPTDVWLERFHRWHDPIRPILESTPDEHLVVNDTWDRRPPAAPWGRGLVTLAGDAAHMAAPTMGQGTCHAFEDAAVLTAALLEQGVNEAALRHYEQIRTPRATAAVRNAHLAAVAGTWTNPVTAGLRALGMSLTPQFAQRRQLRAIFDFQEPVGIADRRLTS